MTCLCARGFRPFWKRAVAAGLGLVLAVAAAAVPEGPAASARGVAAAGVAGRRAVVLVPGPGGLGEAFWQRDEKRGTGLYEALVDAGFSPGVDLFVLTTGETDFTAAVENDLKPLMDELGRRTDIARVDFITHSAGVLTARYYVDTVGGGGPPVGQIIAIAPTSRGSWLVDPVRTAAFRKAMLSHAREQARSGRSGSGAGPSGNHGSPPAEEQLIASLFDAVYPMYRKFLLQGRFLPVGAPQPFGEWLASSDPALARDLADPLPPFGLGSLPGPGVVPPGPGRDLSTSYYTRAALDAAGYVFQQTRPLYEVLAEEWWSAIVATGDWVTTLAIWVAERAARLSFHVASQDVSRIWQEAVTRGFTALSGVDPLDGGLRRLVAENVAGINKGMAAQFLDAGGDAGLTGNVWLSGWNSSRGRSGDVIRTVYIAGAVLPANSALASGALEGDGVVALGDAFLAAEADDEWHVVGGGTAAGHLALPRHKEVAAAVLRALQWDVPAGASGVGPVAAGGAVAAGGKRALGGRRSAGDKPWSARLSAPDARPAYAELPPDAFGSGAAHGASGAAGAAADAGGSKSRGPVLRAEVPAGSPGAWLWAWVTQEGGVRHKINIGHVASGESRYISVGGAGSPPEAIVIGARHHRGGGPRWLPPRTRAAYDRMMKTVSTVELSFVSETPKGAAAIDLVPLGDGGPAREGADPAPPRAAGAPASARVAPSGADGSAEAPRGASGAEAGGGEQEPIIPVIRRSKQTARLQRYMKEHHYWEWEVGGATVHRDFSGNAVGTFTYRFDAPGTFEVKARSMADDDTVLREQLWSITVGADDAAAREEWEFTSYAPVPPTIDVNLEGPVMWVTGRPAQFHVTAHMAAPVYGRILETGVDPGPAFQVIWARPGPGFPVEAAVYAVVLYDYPDGSTQTVQFTEVEQTEVEVLALGSGG